MQLIFTSAYIALPVLIEASGEGEYAFTAWRSVIESLDENCAWIDNDALPSRLSIREAYLRERCIEIFAAKVFRCSGLNLSFDIEIDLPEVWEQAHPNESVFLFEDLKAVASLIRSDQKSPVDLFALNDLMMIVDQARAIGSQALKRSTRKLLWKTAVLKAGGLALSLDV